MYEQVQSIIRKATRAEKLNILDMVAHERCQSNVAELGHNHYCYRHPTFKGDAGSWQTKFCPMPNNFFLLRKELGEHQIPLDVVPDVCIAHHKFSGYQVLSPIARKYFVPLIQFEHTIHYDWPKEKVDQWKQMRGDINIFITDYSRRAWGFDESNSMVIEHCIDTDKFCPKEVPVDLTPLVVANDYVNRTVPLGFDFFSAIKDVEFRVVGDTPGLSNAVDNIDELVNIYQTHPISISTARYSPIPMSILEAMSCGGLVIARPTCGIPDIIKHGVNGLLADTPEQMKNLIKQAQSDIGMRTELGNNARQTILNRFNKERYLNDWKNVFNNI